MSDSPINPITPPASDAVPPKVAPFSAAPNLDATVRPAIHKPVAGGAPKPPSAPSFQAPGTSMGSAGKSAATMRMTGSLSSVTGPIPAVASLRKTGIIAEGVPAEAQQAAKSKTSRISLNDAIGVAPTTASSAPIKTIRLKRPSGLPSAPASAPAEAPASVTQKKTLKLHRPGGVQISRPSLGVGKPAEGAPAAQPVADMPAEGGEIKLAAAPVMVARKRSVSKGATVSSLVFTAAALLVLGAATYFLVVQSLGPEAGPNDTACVHTEQDYRPGR